MDTGSLQKDGSEIRGFKPGDNKRLLLDFHEKPGASVRIFALGDSLLRYSLPSPGEFNSMLGGDTEWLHLCEPAAHWSDFDPLIGDFRALRPSLIIVQDSLLKKREHRPSRLEKAFFNVRKMIGRFVKNILHGVSKPAQNDSRFELAEVQNSLRKTYTSNIPAEPKTLDFIARLKLIGGSVVVIHLPRSSSLNAGREEKEWLDYLQRTLEPMGIPVVTLGQPLPDDHYKADQSHTNDLGRAVRIEQFKKFVSEYAH